MDRRTFFKKGLGASVIAGAALTGNYQNLFAAPHEANDLPFDLVAVKGGESDVMLKKGMEAFGGIGKFVKKGQKVVIEARAVLNTGREHAKWQPTLVCGYKNYPVVAISDACDACGMCVDECPRGVLAVKGKKVEVVDGKLPDCSMCRLCERACMASGIGEEPAIRISAEPDRFIFVVESDGSLPVKEIMERALMYIKQQSEELDHQTSEISGEEKK